MRLALLMCVVALATALPGPAVAQSGASSMQSLVVGLVSTGQVIAGGVPLASGSWGSDYITVSHALSVGATYAILREGMPFAESKPVAACSSRAHGIDVLIVRVKEHAKRPVIEWGDPTELKAGDELALHPRREFRAAPVKIRFVHINLLVWTRESADTWPRQWHNVMVGEGQTESGFSGSPWTMGGKVYGLHKGAVQPTSRPTWYAVAETATRIRQCLTQLHYDALIPQE